MSEGPEQLVIREIRNGISSGTLKAGAQLRQNALAVKLGVSPVPVREALSLLEGEGLVERHRHRGYFVTGHDARDLEDAYRLRRLAEGEAVRASLLTISEEEVAQMEVEMASTIDAAERGDVAQFMSANWRFHFTLFESCERSLLLRHLKLLWGGAASAQAAYLSKAGKMHEMAAEHRLIFDAVCSRDEEFVVRLSDQHRAKGLKWALTSLK